MSLLDQYQLLAAFAAIALAGGAICITGPALIILNRLKGQETATFHLGGLVILQIIGAASLAAYAFFT
jgi:hypothetical protein